MNVFIFDGRLTKDPEQLTTKGGKNFVTIRVAVSRKFKSHDKPDADFFTCFAYDEQAAFILRNFKKGDGILVHGRVENREPFVTRSGDTLKEDLVIIENASPGLKRKSKSDSPESGAVKSSSAISEEEFNEYMDQMGFTEYDLR